MTAGKLKKFANSKEGKEAGLSKSKAKGLGIKSGRESAEWIIRMKSRSASSWTDEMWDWAKRQVAFIKRMSGVKGDLYEDDGVTKTRKHTALLIWGHNPLKTKKLEKGGDIDDWYKNGLEKLRQTDDYKKRQAIGYFIHTSKDIIKTDYFMLVPTKPEHAKEYGIESKRPLFLKRLFIPEEKRLNGEGKKALEEIDKIASEGGYDIVFGYIDQKAKFSKDNRENYFNDVDLIKYFLFDNGYAINSMTNDFHKVLNPEKLKSGGDLQDSKENSNLAISKTDIENVIQGKNIPKQSLFIYQAIDKLRKNASSIINDKRNFLPRALIKDNPNIKKVKLQCDGWSLSFFNTEANAIKRLNEICSDKPELFKKLGTHVSKGVISKGDGICGKVDKRGHFECFEYETTDFKNNFAVKTQVYP